MLFLESCPLDPIPRLWMHNREAFEDGPSAVEFAVSVLEFDVGTPCGFIGLPRHPPLKHLPGP